MYHLPQCTALQTDRQTDDSMVPTADLQLATNYKIINLATKSINISKAAYKIITDLMTEQQK